MSPLSSPTPLEELSESELHAKMVKGEISESAFHATMMKRKRLPKTERKMRNCETVRQKEQCLAELREDDDEVYLAYAHKHPGEVLWQVDAEADRMKAIWEYTGPYVRPWHEGKQERILLRDGPGNPIRIAQRQAELFGDWRKQWEDGPSRVEEDQLLDVGPMGEVIGVEQPGAGGCSWAELADSQREKKEALEKAKRGESGNEMMKAVREFLRRVRRKFTVPKPEAPCVNGSGVVAAKQGAGEVSGKKSREDSGYASTAKGR